MIVLEAELPEGNIAQLAVAIQNALKPAVAVIQQRTQELPSGTLSGSQDMPEIATEEVNDPNLGVSPGLDSRGQRESRSRKPNPPKVLDLDLDGDTPFRSFAAMYKPKTDTDKNLVVLAWFKEFRPDEIVTANHVYTCFRTMAWPAGKDDFAGTLRHLKKEQLVSSSARGQYTINQIGLGKLEKLIA